MPDTRHALVATNLDVEMLKWNVSPGNTRDVDLSRKKGTDVWRELGGRYLIRYLHAGQLGIFGQGTAIPTYTTPTPYPAPEVIARLQLPAVTRARQWILVIDPRKVETILGPRWVRWGGFAIEYILPNGFPQDALATKWEVEIA
jgi:hypothetical protein